VKLIVKLAIALAVGTAGVYLFYQRTLPNDPLDDFTSWPPDSAAIKKSLDADVTVTGAEGDRVRHEEFAKLFQSRFRTHDPEVAIGLRVLGPDMLKLMCPARMEPWNLDRVAMSAWRQARDVLGHSYNIDIYETYIGSPPRKIGELRHAKDNPEIQQISYLSAHPARHSLAQAARED
jgi:hypothetical protein